MPIELSETDSEKIIEVHVSGKIVAEDYAHFVPEVERLVQEHGKLRILFDMVDFHGWSAGALWEDIKFDVQHFRDIERLAMVGDKQWEKGMAVFCGPFTTAEIRYFDRSEAEQARAWLAGE